MGLLLFLLEMFATVVRLLARAWADLDAEFA